MVRYFLPCFVLFCLLTCTDALAHSGRTDAYGCHAGSQPYHCHNGKTPKKSKAQTPRRYKPQPGTAEPKSDSTKDKVIFAIKNSGTVGGCTDLPVRLFLSVTVKGDGALVVQRLSIIGNDDASLAACFMTKISSLHVSGLTGKLPTSLNVSLQL